MIKLSLFAEAFLCLYKMAEEHFDALEDPATLVTEPSFDFHDEWDCSIPSGKLAITIDLTPDDIAADLEECESVDEEVDEEEEELDCAALEDENE